MNKLIHNDFVVNSSCMPSRPYRTRYALGYTYVHQYFHSMPLGCHTRSHLSFCYVPCYFVYQG